MGTSMRTSMGTGMTMTDDTHSARASDTTTETTETTVATRPAPPSFTPRGPQPTPKRPHVFARLLSLPLFYKVLLSNSAIVLLGALAGTTITLHVADANPRGTLDGALIVIFAAFGLALTFCLNALILRAALSPLARLQEVARRVQLGDFAIRAKTSPLADAEIAQLAATLNQILDEVRRYEDQMRALSGSVIRAQEDERARIARELHDDTGQVLTLLLIRLKLLEAEPGAAELQPRIEELRGLVAGAIDQVRRLALNLRPPSLDQLGLAPSLRSLATTYTASTGINFKLTLPREPVRLSLERTIAVYRIAQESLTNIAKHATARNVRIDLVIEGDTLRLEVSDDGRGFDLAAVRIQTDRTQTDHPHDGGPGIGLFGMEERARLAAGTLRIQSAPGRGTLLVLTVPQDQRAG